MSDSAREIAEQVRDIDESRAVDWLDKAERIIADALAAERERCAQTIEDEFPEAPHIAPWLRAVSSELAAKIKGE